MPVAKKYEITLVGVGMGISRLVNEKGNNILPHDYEAERGVIMSIICDSDSAIYTFENLKSDDFYNNDYKIIFDASCELASDNQRIDFVMLNNKLKERNLLSKIGGTQTLKNLCSEFITSANLKEYVKIIKDKSLLRKIIKISSNIVLASYKSQKPAELILSYAEKSIFNIIQTKSSNDFAQLREVLLDVINRIERISKSPEKIIGLSTGFIDFDYRASGLQNSDVMLIAARPSMGKTAFALNIAENIALNQNKGVAIFSLEMSKFQLANRLLCSNAKMDAQKLRTGDLSQKDWSLITESLGNLSQAKIYIDDTPGISVAQLRSKARKLKLEKDISLVIIDYLQLMSGNLKNESRQQEISEISRGLKSIARELDIPIIALSQLSRACEARADHRPMLSDLRESGAIEQDADLVAFLYRDEYYNPESAKKNVAELIIAKQRNGPTGTIELLWDGFCTRFRTLYVT